MATAGYSGTPLPKKLGIKEGTLFATVHAPDDFESTLGTLPPEAEGSPLQIELFRSFWATDKFRQPRHFPNVWD